jgi:serine protease Do
VLVVHGKSSDAAGQSQNPADLQQIQAVDAGQVPSVAGQAVVGPQEAMQIPAAVGPQQPMQIQAGVPAGMNTNALENTYNQIADIMNKITVGIYTNDIGAGAQPLLLGSGVIVSGQLILTNAHIVQNKTNLSVAVSGSPTQYPVSIFRCDAANDLAVLQLTNSGDFPITGILGDSDLVDRGDIVFAMGNAFGTGNLLATGMIINNNVSYVNGQKINNEFQTNINIYQGSCGGPLVNIKGEVIGINNSGTGITSNSYMWIGYATPINRAAGLINSTLPNQTGAPSPFMPVAFNNNPYVLT